MTDFQDQRATERESLRRVRDEIRAAVASSSDPLSVSDLEVRFSAEFRASYVRLAALELINRGEIELTDDYRVRASVAAT